MNCAKSYTVREQTCPIENTNTSNRFSEHLPIQAR